MPKSAVDVFTMRAKLRKREEFEAILWDKVCPLCKSGRLIGKWDMGKLRKYVSFRCSEIACKYGNAAIKPVAADADEINVPL